MDALRVATDDQKKTVKHACEVIALNVAYAALEMRRTDDAPKVHRREIVERLKEAANALNLGVGAVNKDAALLVEWSTRAKTEGRTTDTAISANVWRQVQKLFTNKLNALIIGTNIGGLGTLIASMASLISYKQICRSHPHIKGRYFAYFTAANIAFLAVMALTVKIAY